MLSMNLSQTRISGWRLSVLFRHSSTTSTMTEPIPFPQPASLEGKLQEFDSVPLFMRSLPEDDTDDIAVSALQSLAHEGTPDEIAENFKDQGNNYFKGKRYAEARNFYKQGLDAKPTEPALLDALLCNRAACNLELKNYGFVLHDCSRAISINPRSSKAHYRSAMALLALERFEEALDCCTRCLDFDPTNKSVQQLSDRAQKGKLLQDKKTQERIQERIRMSELKRELDLCYKARHLVLINDSHSETSPYTPHLNKDSQLSRPTLVIPVFFLYPQYATSDLISHYEETVSFSTHLDDMFPPSSAENLERRPEWDKKGEYLAPNLVVYAITHKKRLLKVGKKMSLLDLCDASKGKDGQPDGLEVKNGYLSVVVLPKGSVERRWVEEFKATR